MKLSVLSASKSGLAEVDQPLLKAIEPGFQNLADDRQSSPVSFIFFSFASGQSRPGLIFCLFFLFDPAHSQLRLAAAAGCIIMSAKAAE